jgi:hypothetical protein
MGTHEGCPYDTDNLGFRIVGQRFRTDRCLQPFYQGPAVIDEPAIGVQRQVEEAAGSADVAGVWLRLRLFPWALTGV